MSFRWFRRRRPWTVAIKGKWSDNTTPPLTFLTFRTEEEARAWADERGANDMTEWVVVKQ